MTECPREPQPADYRLSHLAPDKGESYHRAFALNPYRKMMWGFERTALDKIRRRFLAGRPLRHLDFACGTGRVLAHVAPDALVSVGVDVSPGMLAVAKKVAPASELIEADLTVGDVLGGREFDLITAFRFFPNAQPDLRARAIGVLSRHLDPDGVFVFNNHMNRASLRYRLARLLRRGGDEGMGPGEVRSLLDEAGLGVLGTYAYGFTPAGEERTFLPVAWLTAIEKVMSRIRPMRGLGENLIFVCRKSGPPSTKA